MISDASALYTNVVKSIRQIHHQHQCHRMVMQNMCALCTYFVQSTASSTQSNGRRNCDHLKLNKTTWRQARSNQETEWRNWPTLHEQPAVVPIAAATITGAITTDADCFTLIVHKTKWQYKTQMKCFWYTRNWQYSQRLSRVSAYLWTKYVY